MDPELPPVSLVYDNRELAADGIAAIIGRKRYGDIIRLRRSLKEQAGAIAAESGAARFIALETDADAGALRAELQPGKAGAWIYLKARGAVTGPAALAALIQKARYNRENLVSGGADPLLAVFAGDSAFGAFLALPEGGGRPAAAAPEIPAQAMDTAGWLLDISDAANFLAFFSGGSEARSFNRLSGDRHVLVKTSADKAKIRREHRYYHLLPEPMKNWFLMPYDFRENGGEASYSIERLQVPDMALIWIHSGLSAAEFGGFLDEVFDFVASRPARPAQAGACRLRADGLYLDKVGERFKLLLGLPEFARLDKLIAGGAGCDGLAAIIDRYRAAYAALPSGGGEPAEVIGHGDLCFSNMLYHKHTGLLKFIDPKGADSEEELWTDPYYDLAKLSHSVLGLYDFINNDRFSVQAGPDGRLELTIAAPPMTRYQELFLARLEAAGYDARRIRLYETSLFLSMLPLHMDHPRKVLAYALNAVHILDELENNG